MRHPPISTTALVVAGGVVVGAAAIYGGYLAYQYYSEKSNIKWAAKEVGITYQQLSDYMHQNYNFKGPGGTWKGKDLLAIAEEAARYYGKKK